MANLDLLAEKRTKRKCDQNFWNLKKKIQKAATLNCQLPNERGSFKKSEAREYEDECIEN